MLVIIIGMGRATGTLLSEDFSVNYTVGSRSPWSNEYDPPLDDGGTVPSSKMRRLEIQANEAFDTYREMYYEGGVSSVYLWDPEDASGGGNFAGVVVIKKSENLHF